MIRDSKIKDIDAVMNIWLDTNVETHHYISNDYWLQNYDVVKEIIKEIIEKTTKEATKESTKAIDEGVYVYEEQGEILGFLGRVNTYIAGIFVKKESRSKGIGKLLVDYAKDQCDNLALEVYCNNQKAIAFYCREGFQVTATHMNAGTGFEEYRLDWKR